MATKKAPAPRAEGLEAAREQAKKIRRKLKDKPASSALLTRKERANAAPFYFVLRELVSNLKKARESAHLTLEEVSNRSGLAVESLSRLENGALTNPTWKTLGAYAVAVGSKFRLALDHPIHKPSDASDDLRKLPSSRISGLGDDADMNAQLQNKQDLLESVQICELAWADPPKGLGFPAKRVLDVIEHNTRLEKISWKDATAVIYERLSPLGYVELVCAEELNGKRLVSLAIRVFPDLCSKKLDELTPLGIIQEFTERFGLSMYVGSLRGKLILEKETPIPRLIVPGTPPNQFISIENPGNVPYMCGFMLKVVPPNLRIVLACCIDTNAYFDWLKAHR